jgi:uncharacterized RDD family membrane protein YckC
MQRDVVTTMSNYEYDLKQKRKNSDDFSDFERQDYAEFRSYAGVRLAGLGERLIAIIIDNIFLSIVAGILLGSSRHFGGSAVVTILLGAAYQWYFLTRNHGQTVGKMLMKIRVVRTDGVPLTDGQALLRYFGYLFNSLPFLFGAGWWWAIFDSKNQGLHDKIASTIVVEA